MSRIPDSFIDLVNIKEEGSNREEVCSSREALSHKTMLCDRIDSQGRTLTAEINGLESEVDSLYRDKRVLSKKIQEIKTQLDVCKSVAALKDMQEETQRIADNLLSALSDMRGIKRQRS